MDLDALAIRHRIDEALDHPSKADEALDTARRSGLAGTLMDDLTSAVGRARDTLVDAHSLTLDTTTPTDLELMTTLGYIISDIALRHDPTRGPDHGTREGWDPDADADADDTTAHLTALTTTACEWAQAIINTTKEEGDR